MNGQKPLVAIDWDEPLKPFKPGFIEFHNQVHGKQLKHEDAPAFDMSTFMGFPDFDSYMDHVDEYHAYEMENPELAVREEAVFALQSLCTWFEFVIVTTRKTRFKPYTESQVAMMLPGQTVEAFHLEDFESEFGRTKGAFVKELGAVALIDDRPDNVDSAIEHGVYGLLFDDQFNTEYDGPAVRVRNWLEIEEELGRLYKALNGHEPS